MNYIKSLQAENAKLKSDLEETRKKIDNFIVFLHSDKFTGVQSDGSRKDWISTGDTINILRGI
jgi:hypothetical protein